VADADVLFDVTCDRVLERFKLENLKDLQRKALQKLANGEDVFVIQPTGSGKSLIFQSAPMVIDIVKETTFKSIAVVISPLTSLMQDRVKFRKSVGLAAEFIGEDQNDKSRPKRLLKGATAKSSLDHRNHSYVLIDGGRCCRVRCMRRDCASSLHMKLTAFHTGELDNQAEGFVIWAHIESLCSFESLLLNSCTPLTSLKHAFKTQKVQRFSGVLHFLSKLLLKIPFVL